MAPTLAYAISSHAFLCSTLPWFMYAYSADTLSGV